MQQILAFLLASLQPKIYQILISQDKKCTKSYNGKCEKIITNEIIF